MIKFGTGGWRAVIGDNFIKDNIIKVAQAIANDMKDKHWNDTGVVIGYDRRFLSDKTAYWVSEIIAGNGIQVFLIDKIAPTPLIMYTVKELKTKYGMAITASHNPAEYNGIKIFTEGGRDASKDVTGYLEKIIENINPEDIKATQFEKGIEKGTIKIIDPFNKYIDTVLGMIDVNAIRKKGLKILLDPMYGVSKTSLQTILLTARCEVDTIHDRHDTLFGGRLPSPSASTLIQLKDMVIEKGYDLGIGTDGDADRIGIIDDKGNFIHPNEIMILLYYYLLKYKGWKGGVVRNIATTHILDKIANAYGEKCYEVPVGFKHISSKMDETDAVIGGESSGGLTIRGHIKGKDGVFAASLLVEMISVTGKGLSQMLDEIYDKFGKAEMIENNYKFDLETKTRLQKMLFEEKKLPEFEYSIDKVSYMDGLKIYFENGGWVIARFSGTEPLIRVFAEMPTKKQAQQISDIFKEFLNL